MKPFSTHFQKFVASLSVVLLLFSAQPSAAQNTSSNHPTSGDADTLKAGLALYAAQNYLGAYVEFQKGLKKNPTDGALYTNMALSAHKLKKPGVAIGLARHAVSLYPSWAYASQLLRFLEETYRVKRSEGAIFEFVSLRTLDGSYFVWTFLFGAAALFVSLYKFAEYLGERRTFSDELDEEMKPRASSSIFLGLGLAALLFSLTGLQIYRNRLTLATVLPDKAFARAFPESRSAPLFDLRSGQEVEVIQKNQSWYLIEREDGFVGWMSEKELFQHQGPKNDQLLVGKSISN